MAANRRPVRLQEDEPPTESIETEQDRRIKDLTKLQLETDTTIQKQLARKRQFTNGLVYEPESGKVGGVVSLTKYAEITDRDDQLEFLKQCGLTDDEIIFKLNHDKNGIDNRKKKCLGMEPSAYNKKLDDVEKIIASKEQELSKPDSFSGMKYLSRREMDLEQALAHDKEKARMLACLTTSASPDIHEHPNDPMNNLDEMITSIDSRVSGPRHHHHHHPRTNKKRKNKYECQNECCQIQRIDESGTPASCEPKPDNWVDPDDDSKKEPSNQKEHSSGVNYNSDTHTYGKLYTFSNHAVESIPEEIICKYKITLEKILANPRFTNYTTGIPSATLYLKNLSNKVSIEDLASLFLRFQNSNQEMTFKLMSGRMRGQAFVTFPSISAAEKALELVNGYDFKGKPIICTFGKNTNPADLSKKT